MHMNRHSSMGLLKLTLKQHVYCVILIFITNVQVLLETLAFICENIQMIKKSLSKIQMKVCYQCFKLGLEAIESNSCSESLSTRRRAENIERIQVTIKRIQQLQYSVGIG